MTKLLPKQIAWINLHCAEQIKPVERIKRYATEEIRQEKNSPR
jgi:hypothetical protein